MSERDEKKVQIVEERVSIDKEMLVTGRVRVSTSTDNVQDIARATLSGERVQVSRERLGHEIDSVPETRIEGDVTIIPVVEEILVVEKRLILVEEIHIRRVAISEEVAVPVMLRKQTATVERIEEQSTEEITMTYTDQTTSTPASNTITAFFDSRTDADHAVERLVEAGISRDAVRVIASGNDETVVPEQESKGFWASLADMFMPDEDRNVYAEGIRRGGYLVTVSGYAANMHEIALDILDDEGSIDLDERSQAWESEGWSRANSNEALATSEYDRSSGSAGASSRLDADDEEVIPVVEEELRVGKRDVNNGRVKVRSYVTETPVSENVALRDENIKVTRRAVDRPVGGTEDAFVDRTIEAEEHREEAVVSKDARVVEEISLRRTAEQRDETISDTVRKTEVEIDDDRDGSDRKDGTLGIRRD